MDSLRRRVPFKASNDDDSEENDSRILDEQEQETLIRTLRDSNNTSSRQHVLALRTILTLSLFLQLLSFRDNPLSVIVPPATPGPSSSIPLPGLFTILSLLVHINLAFLAFMDYIKPRFHTSHVHPISYQLSYALSAVAPTLSLFLRRPWQSTIWWGLTTTVVFTAQSIMESINEGNKDISELESMKYVAFGA